MKKILIKALIIASTLLLVACNKKDTPKEINNSKLEPSGEAVNIGILPAESSIPIIIAKEKGFFQEESVVVTIKSFSSPNDRNVAVQSKELHATIGDVMTEATLKQNGINMRITSDISEDFKILSSPESGITTMEGLSGKNISLVPNFLLEYIMDEFATLHNFTYEIIEIPSFSGRAEALLSSQIDGVVFTEPQAGMLVAQGANLLGSSKEAGIKGGTIQFMDEIITNRPGDIAAFYRAYNKAIDYMNSTDVSEYSVILSDYGFPDTISSYLTNMTEDFKYADIIEKEQFDKIIDWTVSKGQIKTKYTYKELTDFSFIK